MRSTHDPMATLALFLVALTAGCAADIADVEEDDMGRVDIDMADGNRVDIPPGMLGRGSGGVALLLHGAQAPESDGRLPRKGAVERGWSLRKSVVQVVTGVQGPVDDEGTPVRWGAMEPRGPSGQQPPVGQPVFGGQPTPPSQPAPADGQQPSTTTPPAGQPAAAAPSAPAGSAAPAAAPPVAAPPFDPVYLRWWNGCGTTIGYPGGLGAPGGSGFPGGFGGLGASGGSGGFGFFPG